MSGRVGVPAMGISTYVWPVWSWYSPVLQGLAAEVVGQAWPSGQSAQTNMLALANYPEVQGVTLPPPASHEFPR